MDLVPYIAKQGDHLSLLAQRFGCSPDDIWNEPRNAELKRIRKNPNILSPGDLVYVPKLEPKWLTLKAGTTNTFTAKAHQITVALRFVENGKPLAHAKYEIDGVAVPPGATDDKGGVRLSVPVTTVQFTLRFVERHETHLIRVGHLDPANEASGAWSRLACLGYLGGRARGSGTGSAAELSAALRVFQRSERLDVSGDLDEATVSKLEELFGS